MDALLTTLQTFFSDPAWLIPAAVAVAAQLIGTHNVKPFLPIGWPDPKRDAAISLLSIAIGISAFVGSRWAWLGLAGVDVPAEQFVLSAGVALIVIAAMPLVYAKLPESMRRRFSYEKKVTEKYKVVRAADGRYVDRPLNQPSGPDEETVIGMVERTQPRGEA